MACELPAPPVSRASRPISAWSTRARGQAGDKSRHRAAKAGSAGRARPRGDPEGQPRLVVVMTEQPSLEETDGPIGAVVDYPAPHSAPQSAPQSLNRTARTPRIRSADDDAEVRFTTSRARVTRGRRPDPGRLRHYTGMLGDMNEVVTFTRTTGRFLRTRRGLTRDY